MQWEDPANKSSYRSRKRPIKREPKISAGLQELINIEGACLTKNIVLTTTNQLFIHVTALTYISNLFHGTLLFLYFFF